MSEGGRKKKRENKSAREKRGKGKNEERELRKKRAGGWKDEETLGFLVSGEGLHQHAGPSVSGDASKCQDSFQRLATRKNFTAAVICALLVVEALHGGHVRKDG